MLFRVAARKQIMIRILLPQARMPRPLRRLNDLTGRNPPQAATLEGERLGGFLAGFSQDEDNKMFIIHGFLLRHSLTYGTIVLLEPSGCQSRLRASHLHKR
jgi:hypothetical protein